MINFLHESAEFDEGVRLSLARDFVLDVIGESDVEAPMKSSVTPVADLACQSIPFNDVLRDTLEVTHLQSLEESFCIRNGIVQCNVSLQLVQNTCQ